MTDRLVAKGDSTTTNGQVLGGSSSCYTSTGQTIARRNDLATCGICKGAFPILGTADTWLDEGLPTVRHMDRVLCPCGQNRVLSGNREFLFTSDEAPDSNTRTIVATTSSELTSAVFDEAYVLRDRRSGKPLPGVPYRLIRSNGATAQGVTDHSGRTQRIKTSAAERVILKIEEAE